MYTTSIDPLIRLGDYNSPPSGCFPVGLQIDLAGGMRQLGVSQALINNNVLITGGAAPCASFLAGFAQGVASSPFAALIFGSAEFLERITQQWCITQPESIDRVLWLDFTAAEAPAFNPLAVSDERQIETALLAVLEGLTDGDLRDTATTPAITVISQAVIALCHANLRLGDEYVFNLCHLSIFLTDRTFRDLVIGGVDDPVVQEQFASDAGLFNAMSSREQASLIAPYTDVLDAWLAHSSLHYSLRGRPRLDPQASRDSGALTLIVLPESEAGAQFGRMLLSWWLSMSDPQHPYLLLLEQADRFVTPYHSFLDVMSEDDNGFHTVMALSSELQAESRRPLAELVDQRVLMCGADPEWLETLGWDDALYSEADLSGLEYDRMLLQINRAEIHGSETPLFVLRTLLSQTSERLSTRLKTAAAVFAESYTHSALEYDTRLMACYRTTLPSHHAPGCNDAEDDDAFEVYGGSYFGPYS